MRFPNGNVRQQHKIDLVHRHIRLSPSLRKPVVANMHYNPQLRPEGIVGSEPSHCYRTVFLSFSSDNDHSRSRSLNDIDCGLQFQGVYQCQNYVRSKSSDEALEAVAQTRTYPLTPCQAPFLRSPTPNGLPEFGSREAQELRLVPPSRLRRWQRHFRKECIGSSIIRKAIQKTKEVVSLAPRRLKSHIQYERSQSQELISSDVWWAQPRRSSYQNHQNNHDGQVYPKE